MSVACWYIILPIGTGDSEIVDCSFALSVESDIKVVYIVLAYHETLLSCFICFPGRCPCLPGGLTDTNLHIEICNSHYNSLTEINKCLSAVNHATSY